MSALTHPSIANSTTPIELYPTLHVGGFVPLTTLDYPDHLACVVFCQGCAWRCRYCHNVDLIPPRANDELAWQEIISFLEKRKGLLEGVVFSGGEPTLQRGLLQCIEQVKAMGYLIGLHSAGIKPKLFEQVVSKVDWVGFDIKALPEDHQQITCVQGSGEANWLSLQHLLDSGTDYEVRTTVHWHLLTVEKLERLANRLRTAGVEKFVVQVARHKQMLDAELPVTPPPLEKQQLWDYLAGLFPSFILREA